MHARHIPNAFGQLAVFATCGFLVWLAAGHSAKPSRACKPGCTVCAHSSNTQRVVMDHLLGDTEAAEYQ
jgi:hypothetical protein